MLYRLDVYSPTHPSQPTAVCCIEAATGVEACAGAEKLIAGRQRANREYADVSVDDGTGQFVYYQTVVAQ